MILQVNMSVALIPMANELGWSTTERGLVSAAFFWGYAATQIPAGYIATRIGGAKVLLLGVMIWSVGVPPASIANSNIPETTATCNNCDTCVQALSLLLRWHRWGWSHYACPAPLSAWARALHRLQ